jgi:molybdate transport system substrate-binding protein
VGYSTGPSGTALIKLFEQWGIQQQIAPKLVQARPGVPVGEMVAQGEVALGFQQLSELMHVAGIEILGPLPAAIQVTTVFAAGVCATAHKAQAAADFLSFMAGPDASAAKLAQGMTPA